MEEVKYDNECLESTLYLSMYSMPCEAYPQNSY